MRLVLVCVLASSCTCAEPCLEEPVADDAYDDDDAWLCLPGGDDACAGAPRAEEIARDGTRSIVDVAPRADPPVDCFYVYPTVHLGLTPGLEATDAPTSAERAVAAAQAALYQEACAVSAPLYRQAALGTYGRRVEREVQDRCLDVSTSDVKAAFAAFLARIGPERRYALVGHSQGSHHLQRLLDDVIEEDDALFDRLVVAHAIGGAMSVARGTTLALDRTSLCTAPDETGCILAYRSFPDGHAGPDPENAFAAELFRYDPDERELACVAPSDGPLARTVLPRAFVSGVDVDEKFLSVRDRYAATCARSASDQPFLRVSLHDDGTDDARGDPLQLDDDAWQGTSGLHVVDVGLALGDLVADVARRAGP